MLLKKLSITIIERLNKKMHEVRMWFSWKFFGNIHLFWDFSYVKINCNLSVKSKFNYRRLSTKLPKNTRHSMVEESETFFYWGYCNEMSKAVVRVFCKKGILEIFAKFTRKHLCWSLSLISGYRDSSAGVFLWILQNFKNTYFVEHLGTVASETLHD